MLSRFFSCGTFLSFWCSSQGRCWSWVHPPVLVQRALWPHISLLLLLTIPLSLFKSSAKDCSLEKLAFGCFSAYVHGEHLKHVVAQEAQRMFIIGHNILVLSHRNTTSCCAVMWPLLVRMIAWDVEDDLQHDLRFLIYSRTHIHVIHRTQLLLLLTMCGVWTLSAIWF